MAPLDYSPGSMGAFPPQGPCLGFYRVLGWFSTPSRSSPTFIEFLLTQAARFPQRKEKPKKYEHMRFTGIRTRDIDSSGYSLLRLIKPPTLIPL